MFDGHSVTCSHLTVLLVALILTAETVTECTLDVEALLPPYDTVVTGDETEACGLSGGYPSRFEFVTDLASPTGGGLGSALPTVTTW